MSYPKSRYPWVPAPNPVPTSPPSPDFPYPGLVRTGTKSSRRGRGLVATATFPAGSAIAAFPRPLLCLPDADNVRACCDWCLRPGFTSPPPSASSSDPTSGAGLEQTRTKLSVCTRCRYVAYCGKRCQAAAWKAVHKLECPALCKAKDAVLGVGGKDRAVREERWYVPTAVRAAMQLLLRLGQNDEAVLDAIGSIPIVGGSGGGNGDRKGTLEGNVDGFRSDEKVWNDLGMQARAAIKYAGVEVDGEKAVVAAEGVREVLCKLQTNAFDRRDEDVGAAGVLLDTDLAMANHSCLPNAYVVFVGRTAVLRAEREIREGEEVEISYIGMLLPCTQYDR